MAVAEPKTSNQLAAERTDLAVERTLMGANRTLMAWVRTALSMISFGFTIHKLLQGKTLVGGFVKVDSGRRLGLFLIALGTLCVIMGTIEYFQTARRLDGSFTFNIRRPNMSLVMGGAIGLLGLFLFVTMLAHAEVL